VRERQEAGLTNEAYVLPTSLFDGAQAEIFSTLASDNVGRFVRRDSYKLLSLFLDSKNSSIGVGCSHSEEGEHNHSGDGDAQKTGPSTFSALSIPLLPLGSFTEVGSKQIEDYFNTRKILSFLSKCSDNPNNTISHIQAQTKIVKKFCITLHAPIKEVGESLAIFSLMACNLISYLGAIKSYGIKSEGPLQIRQKISIWHTSAENIT
jgi:hypothetical protein